MTKIIVERLWDGEGTPKFTVEDVLNFLGIKDCEVVGDLLVETEISENSSRSDILKEFRLCVMGHDLSHMNDYVLPEFCKFDTPERNYLCHRIRFCVEKHAIVYEVMSRETVMERLKSI